MKRTHQSDMDVLLMGSFFRYTMEHRNEGVKHEETQIIDDCNDSS